VIKNPEEKLEELRRSSLVEFEHLKAAQTAVRILSNRDMPEHSGMPGKLDGQDDEVPSFTLPEQVHRTSGGGNGATSYIAMMADPADGDQPAYNTTKFPTRTRMESSELSPSSQFPPQTGSVSTVTEEAEIQGQATTTGNPIFNEPDFNPLGEGT